MDRMHAYLVAGLTFGPRIARRVFERIAQARWDERSADDRFSPREVIAHLADWEPIMLQRLAAGVDQPGSTVEAYDESLRAIEQGYAQMDPWGQLERFEALRAETVRYVEALETHQFQNRFVHPERGVMTVDDQANMLLGHDLYHIEQLAAFLGDKIADVW